MKIKKLIIENINSLYGHWEINFEDPAYNDGLFAIMGPTGSGKSTILDAISLALYGVTPRMESDMPLFEVVSKGANSCMASLVFEVKKTDYTANFSFASYKKSSKKAVKGQLDKSKHYHTLSADDKEIASGKEVKNKVTELTGMNSGQFFRAVLLAQGKFDAFLQADYQKKSEILEQVTGTAIYTKIAQRIFQRSSSAQKAVELANAERKGILLIEAEAEAQKQQELKEKYDISAEQKKQYAALESILTAFVQIRDTEKDLQKNITASNQLEEEKKEFAPLLSKLQAGEKAARIEEAYQNFSACSQKYNETRKHLEQLRLDRPLLEAARNEKNLAAAAAEEILKRTRKNEDELNTLITKVVQLDNSAQLQKKNIESQTAQLQSFQKNHSVALTEKNKLTAALTDLTAEKEKSQSYLESHSGDDKLQQFRAAWQEKAAYFHTRSMALKTKEKEISRFRKEFENAEQVSANARKEFDAASAACDNAAKDESAKRNILAELLAGTSREKLEEERELRTRILTQAQTILDFAEARKQLSDNTPCPLCGSLDHPFALGNIPEISADKKALEEVENKLKKCAQAEKSIAAAEHTKANRQICKTQAEGTLKAAQISLEEKQKALQTIEEEKRILDAELSLKAKELQEELKAFSLNWNGEKTLPADLDKRINLWQDASEKFNSSDGKQQILRAQIEDAERRLTENQTAIDNQKNILETAQKELSRLQEERGALFGDKNCEQERTQAQNESQKALQQFQALADALTAAKTQFDNCEKALTETIRGLEECETALKNAERSYQTKCLTEEMPPETFIASRLTPGELGKLSRINGSLIERGKIFDEQKKQLTQNLDELKKRLPPEADENQLKAELEQLQQQMDEINKAIGALDSELKNNNINKIKYADLREKIDKLTQEQKLWGELDALIGGADGQKFRRLAQQITMDQLLEKSNEIQRSMNGRYELLSSLTEGKLDIDVIDHWQGDEIRPSGNLSGGERFQVSLALALGLSTMTGSNIHIDSLFLDEGFGTLDPTSLETALHTLASLQTAQGKSIGIISHVQSIGENFASVIEVTPAGGGRSTLSGPGITSH